MSSSGGSGGRSILEAVDEDGDRSNRFATKKKSKVNKNKIKRSHNGFEMNDPSMLLDTSLDGTRMIPSRLQPDNDSPCIVSIIFISNPGIRKSVRRRFR